MEIMSKIILGIAMLVTTQSVYADNINSRMRNQERRISQGVKNGTMTKDEARLERAKLREIRAEKRAMRRAGGGRLTRADRKQLKQELNQNSKQISQEKHDGVTGTVPAVAAPAAGQ